ncbi:MAG: TerB family tellurite resistance protein [Betaproteobacteria bacterium]|nr:TerB family tellurite resistance protein [Betaproteobacteria bacterium]
MLTAIRDFFERNLDPSRSERDSERTIEIATAALLLEMLRMDGDIDAAERATILQAVRSRFGLTPEQADELFALAERQASQATDYFQFTSLLNRHFSAEQKVQMIEQMWRVAYADEELSAWEQHLVRKVAELLYVPHADYIAAKLRAKAAHG